MSFTQTLRTALTSLGTNKLRAGLALLGIVIGVMAVITLMSIGRGAQESITSRIQSLGTNLLFITPQGTDAQLTLGDAESLLNPVYAPSIRATAPEVRAATRIIAGRESTGVPVHWGLAVVGTRL